MSGLARCTSRCVSRSMRTASMRCFSSSGSGFEVKTITDGDNERFPAQGQTAVVHYCGKLQDGTKFDSSRDRGEPFRFQVGVGQVIQAWDQGVATLSVGQRAEIVAPPEMAYGPGGIPGVIPENATLIFDVELIDLE